MLDVIVGSNENVKKNAKKGTRITVDKRAHSYMTHQ